MGALDYLSNFCTVTSTGRRKRKPLQTVEIKVKMDCDGCERRVKNAVKNMKGGFIILLYMHVLHFLKLFSLNYSEGVTNVEVRRKQHRVTVSGYVDPNKVLKRVKSTGKRAEFWPYIPYNLVQYPYVSQAYDKRAPSGFVRNVAQAVPVPNASDETITYLFSDDNPNACHIM
ncbi:heavy metal-associated isoprenylated plant protein 21-like isoform X1 [Olea europaea var. sylvestris]|uniref:heavy metal-associated isoprenylated plant protein 21-like isoform X1 n=1 Tax=Olea europaea var. sylvestris TaxID=158386 RepID=UPI000C1D39C1|nr:heavy metal-associated isoprenylated plant protein 21-like isoform X1 [Olea europaea var. sylvestris]